jgi:hypothetical protein
VALLSTFTLVGALHDLPLLAQNAAFQNKAAVPAGIIMLGLSGVLFVVWTGAARAMRSLASSFAGTHRLIGATLMIPCILLVRWAAHRFVG